MNADAPNTTDERPHFCLHKRHPILAVEERAREIYMAQWGERGGWWELNQTPQCWWKMAEKELAAERPPGFTTTKNLSTDMEPF